ncbi:MAG: hypothetical protein WC340_01830 [Kiritimatiellia bacterium]
MNSEPWLRSQKSGVRSQDLRASVDTDTDNAPSSSTKQSPGDSFAGNVGGASCPSAALEGLEAPPTLDREIREISA